MLLFVSNKDMKYFLSYGAVLFVQVLFVLVILRLVLFVQVLFVRTPESIHNGNVVRPFNNYAIFRIRLHVLILVIVRHTVNTLLNLKAQTFCFNP